MKTYILLIKHYLFWLLVFFVQRAIFLIYYHQQIALEGISSTELYKTFLAAWKLDTSTAFYLLLLPFLLSVLYRIKPAKFYNAVQNVYTALMLMVYLMITAGETGLYGEWQTKLSFKALLYFRHPREVFQSATTGEIVLFFSLVILQFFLFFFIYRKYVFVSFEKAKKGSGFVLTAVNHLFIAGLLFLGIRGGFQAIPITASQAYFSKHQILNIASVNPGYNLVFNTLDYFKVDKYNIFKTMPEEKARSVVKRLHEIPRDTTVHILRFKKPNVVILFLESFSGDLIESLGGDPRIAPNFHEMEKDGLLFTQFYATGNRSQEALASVYGGLPAVPVTTLTDHPEKYKSVPSLIKIMKKNGYYTSFLFGGQLIYGNIKSYLIYNEFDSITEGKDLDPSLPRQMLGVPDEYMLKVFLRQLDSLPRPFFANAFTLSSHSPYDVPGGWPLTWVHPENKFVNSAHYTDKALGEFFREAKRQPWWDSTLFVVLADHSHMSYHNYLPGTFEYRRIPLLLTGGALKEEYRGKRDSTLMSNVDVTATLLHQLGYDSRAFFWSKNVFNPYSPRFASFEFYSTFGWKRPYGEFIKDMKTGNVWKFEAPKDKIERMRNEGLAYMQELFDYFMHL